MFKHLTAPFMLIAFCLGLMVSCSEKEYPTEGGQSEEQETIYTFNLDIDELSVLPAQTEQIVDTKKEESEVEAAKPLTRNIEFTVPKSGNLPSIALQENGTIDVYLLLYPSEGYYGNKIFYSKNPVKLRVNKGKLRMTHRQVEFVGGKGLNFNGDMAMNNRDKWMLSAVYAHGGTLNHGELSFQTTMPNRFLNAGEKLIVGRDINIPFVLGTKKGQDYVPGVPLDMTTTARQGFPEAKNMANYTFSIKKDANGKTIENFGFYPLGTLFCLRFKNDMKNIDASSVLIDPGYWLGRNGNLSALKRSYDYQVKKVSCRTTSGKGVFKIKESAEFHPNHPLTLSFNVDNSRPVHLDVEGNETPWLYFWQSSKGGAEDNALEITFDMYNKILKMDKVARVYTVSASSLKQGRTYHKLLKLKNTLALSPLYTVGPTFTSFMDEKLTWGNSSLSNKDIGTESFRGVGLPYTSRQLSDNNNRFLKPFVIKNPYGVSAPGDNLKWILPSYKVIRSVFPKDINFITCVNYNDVHAGEPEITEDVVVDGEKIKDKAVYYSNGVRDIIGDKQRSGNSLRIYYAIRYVGTKYVSAWRYIEKGRWNSEINNPNDQSIASKYIIQSRALALSTGADKKNGKYEYNSAKAKAFLREHIIKNSFWSDEVGDGDALNINSIDYLKPDVIKREFSLIGQARLGAGMQNVGQCFNVWLYPESSSPIYTYIYQVSNHERENLQQVRTLKTRGRSMVLPFLMPGQGK